MDTLEYLRKVSRRWKGILGLVLVCGLAAAGLTLLTTPRYTAQTQLFFSVEGGTSVSDLDSGSQFLARQMPSYAVVATSPRILDPVAKQLSLPDMREKPLSLVAAKTQPDTVVLTIDASSDQPESAAIIADAVARQLAQQVPELSQSSRLGGRGTVTATVLAPAKIPQKPSLPNAPLNIGLGLLIGFALGITLATVRISRAGNHAPSPRSGEQPRHRGGSTRHFEG